MITVLPLSGTVGLKVALVIIFLISLFCKGKSYNDLIIIFIGAYNKIIYNVYEIAF